ncbi:unnamed protein product [Moneuplotes crassus]|uniref:LITAF domain-containing protein n=1 Tax=Euplotes crassus TaxID=5936 RepID=A0AAD2D6H5_EUPCR|nr:unnamed protein product [Moneuplotes crassus]
MNDNSEIGMKEMIESSRDESKRKQYEFDHERYEKERATPNIEEIAIPSQILVSGQRGNLRKKNAYTTQERLETDVNIIYKNLDLGHANILLLKKKRTATIVRCHFCNHKVKTFVLKRRSCRQKLCCCFMFCTILCCVYSCIPLCIDSCFNYDHYCTYCNRYLGCT